MGVDDRPAVQHPRTQNLHETGGDHEIRLVLGDAGGQRRVPGRAGGVIADPGDERRDGGALGAGQTLDAVAVGPDGDDGGAEGVIGRGVQQGL